MVSGGPYVDLVGEGGLLGVCEVVEHYLEDQGLVFRRQVPGANRRGQLGAGDAETQMNRPENAALAGVVGPTNTRCLCASMSPSFRRR